MSVEFDYITKHTDGLISKEIDDYVTNTVLKKSRYIFIENIAGEKIGHCTHCQTAIPYTKLMKHNSDYICPQCLSQCKVKHAWRGHKYLEDTACFLYFEKSKSEPDSIVGLGFYVSRDYRNGFRDVKNSYVPEAVYIFGEKTKMFTFSYWGNRWNERKSIFEFNINSLARLDYFFCTESLRKSINGTRFQYCPFKDYSRWNELKLLTLYSKYPIIEQITKIGMKTLIEAAIQGWATYGAVNWRAKDIYKFLKIEKKDFKELRDSKSCVSFLLLKLYQKSIKEKANLSANEIQLLHDELQHCSYETFEKLSKYVNMRKITKYIEKQKNSPECKNYYSILSTWNDYIIDCIKLKFDLTKDNVLFPKSLYRAHQNTIKQIKYQEDKALNEKMEKLVKSLTEKYQFELDGLILRPAYSSKELIEEGKALNHCVGGYAKRYADGETIILFIRKVAELDKPFYTMEISSNSIRQVRGKGNCSMTKEVEAFVEKFKAKKLRTTKKTQKVKIPA